MSWPHRLHRGWFVGLAVVAMLLVAMAPGLHLSPRHTPTTTRAAAAVGHSAAPVTSRPVTSRPAHLRHGNASTPALQHLDLTTAPDADISLDLPAGWLPVSAAPAAPLLTSVVLPHGRAPPAL